MRHLPRWLPAMVKFGVKGGAGLLVNLALLTLVVEFTPVPESLAIFVAWAITLVPGYVATDKWVFAVFPSPDGVGSHAHRGGLFYGVMWSGKALNYAIYLGLLYLAVPYQAAWAIGAVVVFPLTFGVNYACWKFDARGVGELVRAVRRHAVH